MSKIRVLVTGSSGFIGSHIVDRLLTRTDYEIIGYDLWFNYDDLRHQLENKRFNFIKASILDDEKLEEAVKNVNIIIHLAAILGTSETLEKYSPIDVVNVNVIGTLKVLELARKYENIERVIIPSTPDVPWFNPYKITKIAMERFALMYYMYYAVKTVILKLTNVYGPRERWLEGPFNAPYSYQKVVPTFVVNALLNKPLPIFGDGSQCADYIYVEDVADAFVKAIKSDKAVGRVIPIGTGRSLSVNELADIIIKMTGSRSRKLYLPMRRGETPVDICIDPSFAKIYLGFEAKTHIKEGLRKTIPYYREKLIKLGLLKGKN
ncbi:MAG: NAD-dependent epimerase/dehydratase family protein [Candidatus Njordarchaeales archaeon]